jgi:anti-sigma factor RsiW
MTDHLDDALSALLDSELRPSETAEAQHHLAACALCRSELEQVSQARGWVRALPPVEPPGLFFQTLLDRPAPADEPGPIARRRRPLAILVGGAAASVALVSLSSAPRLPSGSPALPPTRSTAVVGDPIVNLAPEGVPVSLRR